MRGEAHNVERSGTNCRMNYHDRGDRRIAVLGAEFR
jgi:hypothetical protein